MNRYYFASAVSGLGWSLLALFLGGRHLKGALLGGVLASPLIGLLVGRLYLSAYALGTGGRAVASLATLYLSAALFGLAGGAGDPQFFFAVLWGLTFTGYFVLLWPLAYLNHSLIARLREEAPPPSPAPAAPAVPAAPRPARRPKPGDRLLKPLALALAAASLFEGGRSTLFLWSSRPAEGVIVEYRHGRGYRGGSIFTPVVEWVGPDGKTRRVSPRINIANSPYEGRGQRVAVRYDPADPDVARLDAFSDHWFHALMFGCLSLFLFLAHRFAGSPTAVPPA